MSRIALVVDDSRVARMMLKRLLAASDFESIEQGSGEEALSYLQSTNEKPDVIFMDVMMAGIDGLEATRQIKANSALADIPVVICTGKDGEADREKALATGAIAVLTKPPSGEALSNILAALPSKTITTEPAIASEPQVVPINEAKLIAKVIATIEQTIVPKIQQNVRGYTEDISRQIAADTAEKMVGYQVKLALEAQLPAMIEQLKTQIQQAAEDAGQQAVKRAASETVGSIAEQAVHSVIAETDFSTQVLESLSITGTAWLNHQEKRLQTKLEQGLSSSISQHLESTLATTVSPIVTPLVNQQLALQAVNNDEDERDEKIEKLNNKVSLLNSFVIGLAVVIIAIGAFTFLN